MSSATDDVVAQAVADNPGASVRELVRILEKPHSSVQDALTRLYNTGRIERTKQRLRVGRGRFAYRHWPAKSGERMGAAS